MSSVGAASRTREGDPLARSCDAAPTELNRSFVAKAIKIGLLRSRGQHATVSPLRCETVARTHPASGVAAATLMEREYSAEMTARPERERLGRGEVDHGHESRSRFPRHPDAGKEWIRGHQIS